MFGLIGTNGAGKSTFLRMAAGILKPDEGSITVDGQSVFENEETKRRFFYISDEQYFFSNATPLEMMTYYRKLYPAFDAERFHRLMGNFELNEKRKLNTFSKGMKKQVSVILGICANTDYIFCDETFDGLDPVMRQTVKSLFANDMEERNLTPHHCLPQPAGAGGHLRPCGPSAQGRHPALQGFRRHEAKHSQGAVRA